MNTLNTQQVDLFPSVTNPLLDQLVMALDGRVKDGVLLASLFEEHLRSFAGRADFDSQMGMVFGEGNDYGGLRDDFMAGNFGSFPLVEVRSHTMQEAFA